MKIEALSVRLIPQVERLMGLGAPFIRVRTSSDYWLYAALFSSTCPVAIIDEAVAGAVIAFRSQDNPGDVYVQDVMVHPDHRKQGIARRLLASVRSRAAAWNCARIYLTSEPENTAAHHAWTSMGFANAPGDQVVGEVHVIADFKGPGKDRAVYELSLR